MNSISEVHPSPQPDSATAPSSWRIPYTHCPICGGVNSQRLGTYDCSRHKLYHEPLPKVLTWLACSACGHVYTDSYYSEAGLALLFSKAHDNQLAGGDLDGQRLVFGKIINRIVRFLDEDLFSTAPTWLDAGCGNGALVFTAAEHGFSAFGLDVREEAVQRIRQLGYEAYTGDLMQLSLKYPLSVLSLADVLEHLPYPIAALRKAHDLLKPGGVLFVSCPNMECSSWRAMDAMQANPYWHELEHYHNFSRTRLCQILTRCGFQPVDYAPSERYKACMEVIALRPAKSGGFAARQPTTAHHEAVAPSS